MSMERYISLPALIRMVLGVPLLILGSALFLPAWLATQLQPSVQLALGNQRGALDSRIGAVIGGVITLVIGMVLASTVNTQAARTGGAANIGSFTGAQALNDLIPLVYIAAIVMVGVGLIGMGGAGYIGVGPMSRN